MLAVGCFVGDIVELVAYNTVSAGGGAYGIGNLVEDLSPQLGGDLDLFNKSITGTGNINITGVITATKFVGDGSGLTGIVASGSGVIIKDSGSVVGTAGTIDFGNNLSVSPISAGIVTITASGGGGGGVSGINTISGVVNIANDLDVDGHTNLDNVSIAGVSTFTGITTFSNDITFSGSSSSIYANWDQSGNALFFRDSSHVKFGNNNGMELTHSGGATGNGNINNRQGGLVIRTIGSDAGDIFIDSKDDIQIRTHDTSNSILCTGGAEVKLYFAGNEKLTTTSTGVSTVSYTHLTLPTICSV